MPLGKGISIQCNKCGYSATLFEGLGNRNKDFENFRKRLNKSDNEFIDYILSKGTTKEVIYHDSYGRCDKCGDLSTINYIKIHYDEDKIFNLEYKCHVCEGKYIPVNLEEVLNSNCPKCYNERFDSFMSMNWE